MITNERQYKITRSEADRFHRALVQFEDGPRAGVHPMLVKAERDALVSVLEDLRAELAEYERLKATNVSVISITSFDELGEGLIKARIAAGLSQKELAERLGLKEQQIQRYEVERYNSASYRRLRDVADGIGVRIHHDILMPVAPGNLEGLVNKLRQVGLDREFLFSRLLSSADAARAAGEVHGEDEDAVSAKACVALNKVFGWTQANLFEAQPLPAPRLAAAAARFKMPAGRTQAVTSLYAAYANFLAVVVLKGIRNLPKEVIPDDPVTMRKQIIDRYGELSLFSALQHSWDLGVPVLPLRDRGTFHGACWRYGARNVIVLKQTSKHEARWLFDLLHELFHAAQRPESETMEVIEADETSAERRQSNDEIAASQFAGEVVLDMRAEALAQSCVEMATGSVERLKKVVPEVASREGVNVGALANYMAIRLSWQNIDWWGTASNLQGDDKDPWLIARDVFIDRFPFVFENDLERQLLNRALN